MLKLFLPVLLFSITLLCSGQNGNSSPKIEILNFNQFEPLLHKANDTLYLVNFWASWCGPCREEFSAFQQAAKKYSGQKFRLIMVSLDIPSQLESKLKPFFIFFQNENHSLFFRILFYITGRISKKRIFLFLRLGYAQT